MSEAYIIDAVRTPRGIGKVGKGALAGMHPQHLAAAVLKALQKRNDLTPPRWMTLSGEPARRSASKAATWDAWLPWMPASTRGPAV